MKSWAVILALLASPVASAEVPSLGLPDGARMVLDQIRPDTGHDLPIGPFAGFLPTDPREGLVTLRVWQMAGEMQTLRLLDPLRDQIIAAGFTPVFACRDVACGGYDFRFATEVAPPPEMQVDLTDFLFLSAARQDERLSLLVSRAGRTGFVQMIHVAPMLAATGQPAAQTPAAPAVPAAPAGAAPAAPVASGAGDPSFGPQLLSVGRVVLADLSFATGAAELGPGPFASLDALARFLAENTARRVALVGHTDAVGTLDGNIALSERRAVAVLERLVSEYSVARGQVEARGIGYLAPLMPSTTPEGRDQNRRVEAVLLAAN
jgi:OOP family OmpA-OmpF porin